VPEKLITNKDLEKMVDTTDEWITSRTGIKQRYVCTHESTSDLAAAAAKKALDSAGLSASEVGAIVLGTSAPDMLFPSTACLVQQKLSIGHCPAFDLSAACSSFVYALTVASNMVELGQLDNVLVIGSDALSKMVDWRDRTTCILFGDGAGAFLLKRTNVKDERGILKNYLDADGSDWGMLQIPAGGTARPSSIETVKNREHYIKMNGREVFKFAVRIVPQTCDKLLEDSGLEINDIRYLIPHQANKRIITAAAERLSISEDKIFCNIEKYGNTSSASIPIAVDELYNGKMINKGDYLMLIAFGAGLTWGGNLIKWTM
jgi:3-oxoacyl-[acyl-carrier-protein] synthase-3